MRHSDISGEATNAVPVPLGHGDAGRGGETHAARPREASRA